MAMGGTDILGGLKVLLTLQSFHGSNWWVRSWLVEWQWLQSDLNPCIIHFGCGNNN